MKTKYKSHLKFDSCWYNNFFKIKSNYKSNSQRAHILCEKNKNKNENKK